MMRLQRIPERGLCLPTSFAMALGIPVARLLDRLHGWHTVIYPDLPEPLCWRGIHIQEVIHLALDMGYAVTPCELFPRIAGPYGNRDHPVLFDNVGEDHNWRLFRRTILETRGVLTGIGEEPVQLAHAVAYDHGTIHDPHGLTYAYSLEECEKRGFYGSIAWRIDRIREGT